MTDHHSHPFYGKDIYREQEEKFVKELLKKYKGETADEALKKKIWDELQMEKHKGNLNIPFKVVMKKDRSGKFPPCIEVILDTKV